MGLLFCEQLWLSSVASSYLIQAVLFFVCLFVLLLATHVFYSVAHAGLIAVPSELTASKHLVAKVSLLDWNPFVLVASALFVDEHCCLHVQGSLVFS